MTSCTAGVVPSMFLIPVTIQQYTHTVEYSNSARVGTTGVRSSGPSIQSRVRRTLYAQQYQDAWCALFIVSACLVCTIHSIGVLDTLLILIASACLESTRPRGSGAPGTDTTININTAAAGVPGGLVVVRVPTKINFVGSSPTECMLVRAFSCMKEID